MSDIPIVGVASLEGLVVLGVYLLVASVMLILLAPALAALFTLRAADIAGHVVWLLGGG